MAGDLLGRLSGTGNPYAMNTYTPVVNEKNMLIITDYFKLLAIQLTNQDMTNPIDNSEIMAQMTQMVMIQAVSAVTESVQTSTLASTQVYTVGLVRQETAVVITEKGKHGQDMAVEVQYRKVESVDSMGSTPALKLVGDDDKYFLSYIPGMGKIDGPYKKDEAGGKQTKEKDVESEKTDFPACDYTAEEGNLLTDKGTFV